MEETIKKIRKDLGAYLTSVLIPMAVGMLSMPIYTRMLSTSQFGSYGIYSTTYMVLGMFLFEWLGQGIMRFFPEYDRKGELKLLGSAVAGFILALAVVLIVAAVILSLVRGEASFLIGALFVLSTGLVLTTTSVLKAKLRSDLYLKMSSSVTVAQFALSVALLWFFRSFWMLFVARIIVNTLIVALIATRPAVRLEIGTDKALPAAAEGLRAMFMYGLPIILTGLGSKGLQVSDRYFVDFYLGKDQTGIYIANYMICDTIGTVLFAPIMMATHNTVIKLYAKDQIDQVKVLLLNIKKAILILTVPICSYLAIFHRESSLVFVSPPFAVGSAILPVVTLGIVILNYAMYNLKIFEFQLRSIEITKRILASFLFNIGLNFFAIRMFGIMGAALSTLLAYVLLGGLSWAANRKARFVGRISPRFLVVVAGLNLACLAGWWLEKRLLATQGYSYAVNLGVVLATALPIYAGYLLVNLKVTRTLKWFGT
jgi:O-antigen/teichoic acid export membrane protein